MRALDEDTIGFSFLLSSSPLGQTAVSGNLYAFIYIMLTNQGTELLSWLGDQTVITSQSSKIQFPSQD